MQVFKTKIIRWISLSLLLMAANLLLLTPITYCIKTRIIISWSSKLIKIEYLRRIESFNLIWYKKEKVLKGQILKNQTKEKLETRKQWKSRILKP
jgi:hypothetical protein